MKAAISVDRLSKLYRVGAAGDRYHTLRESLAGAVRSAGRRLRSLFRAGTSVAGQAAGQAAGQDDKQALWALKDVSLEVQPGEVVGVIGRNGAGKSTLLKVLSRITEPTSGRVELRGRVGSLLEVGTGFHTELTGRENIYLNGAICGMSRRDISRNFDEIVAFSEVEAFLDTPVKRYSSGMFMKLAFAVASHLDPEVLMVDEVLAVGDMAFQRKCLGKMDEVSRSGRTVLFVSHNMASILNLCRKAAVLQRGKLIFLGDCEKAVELYTSGCSTAAGSDVNLSDHPRRRPGSPVMLGHVRLLNGAGQPADQILCGEPVTIEIDLDPACGPGEHHIGVGFDDNLGCRLFTVGTYLTDSLKDSSKNRRRFRCELDTLPLAPGRYGISINAGSRLFPWTDYIDQALWFEVVAADFYGNGRLSAPDCGRFLVRSHWTTHAD